MDRHIEHLAPDYSKTKRWNQISCGIMMNELATLWSEEKVDLMAYFLKLFCFWWYFFNNKEQFYVKTILNKMETFLLCGVAVFFFFQRVCWKVFHQSYKFLINVILWNLRSWKQDNSTCRENKGTESIGEYNSVSVSLVLKTVYISFCSQSLYVCTYRLTSFRMAQKVLGRGLLDSPPKKK